MRAVVTIAGLLVSLVVVACKSDDKEPIAPASEVVIPTSQQGRCRPCRLRPERVSGKRPLRRDGEESLVSAGVDADGRCVRAMELAADFCASGQTTTVHAYSAEKPFVPTRGDKATHDVRSLWWSVEDLGIPLLGFECELHGRWVKLKYWYAHSGLKYAEASFDGQHETWSFFHEDGTGRIPMECPTDECPLEPAVECDDLPTRP